MVLKEMWTDKEKILLDDVCVCLEKNGKTEMHRQLHVNLIALEYQALALSLYPSILHSNRLGGTERNIESLVSILSERYRDEDVFVMPTKAILCRSYEIGRINVLYMVNHIINILRDQGIDFETESPLSFVGSRMISIMTEDVLLDLLSDPLLEEIKPFAVKTLAGIWEDRTSAEAISFNPELRNMWLLRQSMIPVFGTLLGTHEFISLCRHANDVCLQYILHSAHIPDEASALEEFLFGLNYEELCTVKEYLEKTGKGSINRDEIIKVLKIDKIAFDDKSDDPLELYRFFNHRRRKAFSRQDIRTKGPVRTFEENFMAYLLKKNSEIVNIGEKVNIS